MERLFTKDTQAIFWNNNKTAIQRMLVYDYVSREITICCWIVAPYKLQPIWGRFFWGVADEIMGSHSLGNSGDC